MRTQIELENVNLNAANFLMTLYYLIIIVIISKVVEVQDILRLFLLKD